MPFNSNKSGTWNGEHDFKNYKTTKIELCIALIIK